jgi:hypothetical protein
VEKYCHRSIRCNNIFPYRNQANVKDTIIPASRDFQYALFLSRDAKDKAVARPLPLLLPGSLSQVAIHPAQYVLLPRPHGKDKEERHQQQAPPLPGPDGGSAKNRG